MKTVRLDTADAGRSPLGAFIRYLADGPHGNMIHSTVPPGMVGRAAHFRTIDEYWFVLSGSGEVWRRAQDGNETITELEPGTCVDLPLGTTFQYRCRGDEALTFICVAMPAWPGDDEAVVVDGVWPVNPDT
jgi:mannose-6-phosphate isomerase-like protein (cupin superfamily)